MTPPVVWSIAGNDSGGGAGLSADLRAATAFGVHLCPVVAAVTAQNSCAVTRIEPVSPDLLEAQLDALEGDLPPAAVKTGLLGNVAHVAAVARRIDRLRQRAPVALVVDPVLGASTGAAFADEAALNAYRDLLLPRATVVTPNGREARVLAGEGGVPALAAALKTLGAHSVSVTGGDDPHAVAGWSLDWIDTPHASGWLALPRVATSHTHGTGCTFATSAAAALALGFVTADALILAKMATAYALRHGYAAGQGAGPVWARPGFGAEPSLMPFFSWPDDVDLAAWWQGVQAAQTVQTEQTTRQTRAARSEDTEQETDHAIGLYAIADSAARIEQALAAGVRTLQLRVKAPPQPDDAWRAALRDTVTRSAALCHRAGARLYINDHAALVLEMARNMGSHSQTALGLHLGQEDLAALGAQGRASVMDCVRAGDLQLGVSSHSPWVLARARSLGSAYIACGPVWPTLTKDMPWRAQGMDNLAWWVRMAGRPVVAIGGILEPAQLAQAAQTGASGLCVVRGLGADPAATVPALQRAIAQGRGGARIPAPARPHPSLPNGFNLETTVER